MRLHVKHSLLSPPPAPNTTFSRNPLSKPTFDKEKCGQTNKNTRNPCYSFIRSLLLGRWSRQLRKNCARVNMVYSRAERMFIFEHYCAPKSFSVLREAFNNVYPDKEVPNKTTIHGLVTKSRNTGTVCLWKVSIERQNIWNYGSTDFKQCISCKHWIRLHEFNTDIGSFVLCPERFTCRS
jgi:hypothetical protein